MLTRMNLPLMALLEGMGERHAADLPVRRLKALVAAT